MSVYIGVKVYATLPKGVLVELTSHSSSLTRIPCSTKLRKTEGVISMVKSYSKDKKLLCQLAINEKVVSNIA